MRPGCVRARRRTTCTRRGADRRSRVAWYGEWTTWSHQLIGGGRRAREAFGWVTACFRYVRVSGPPRRSARVPELRRPRRGTHVGLRRHVPPIELELHLGGGM